MDDRYKAKLKKEMMYFSGIDQVADPRLIRWEAMRFQRHNKNYRLLMAVCRLVLSGMLQTTESGRRHLFSFQEIRDLPEQEKMYELYERFVRNYYAQEYRRFPGFTSRAETMFWQEEQNDIKLLPMMRTDITLTWGRKILIIDTKYYQHTLDENEDNGNQFISPEHLYQIFAYVKNKEAYMNKNITSPKLQYEVAGMLLYAKTNEARHPDHTYQFMGSQISVRTLDLNTEFINIRRQLDDIVRAYFGLDINAR